MVAIHAFDPITLETEGIRDLCEFQASRSYTKKQSKLERVNTPAMQMNQVHLSLCKKLEEVAYI